MVKYNKELLLKTQKGKKKFLKEFNRLQEGKKKGFFKRLFSKLR